MSFVSIVLLILTFAVNFVFNFAFWVIVYQLIIFFIPDHHLPLGDAGWYFLIKLTCLSVLLPACFSSLGWMQRFYVWSYGGRTAKGEDYDRIYSLIANICERGNLDPSVYKLYVSKDPSINAFALGSRHIVVNRGMLDIFSDEELLGVLAHEMGHLQYKHTMAILICCGMEFFNRIICFVYDVMNFLGKLVIWIPLFGWAVAIFLMLVNLQYAICTWLLSVPMFFINMFGSRRNEYQADGYACRIGLGRNLLIGFNHMVMMGDQKLGFFESFRVDHPDTGKRIKKIEKYLAKHGE